MNESQLPLSGMRVAALIADGFEESEYTVPCERLRSLGVEVVTVSPCPGKVVRAWDGEQSDWGNRYPIDLSLDDADPVMFDGLLLPGGILNSDTLRQNEDALCFMGQFFDENLPVAAICHAPHILVNAIDLDGVQLTSRASIREDMENAGAEWVDEEVVVSGNLITGRSLDDLAAFSDAFCDRLAENIGVMAQ